MDIEKRFSLVTLTIPEGGTVSNVVDASPYSTATYIGDGSALKEGTALLYYGSLDGVIFAPFDSLIGAAANEVDALSVTIPGVKYMRIGSVTNETVTPAAQTAEVTVVIGLKT